MDRQEFNARFTLLECLQDSDIRSFSALSDGDEEVSVHLLPDASHAQLTVLRADLERLIDQNLEGLEVFEMAGRTVVVTAPIAPGETLEGWLLDRVSEIAEPAPDSFELLMGLDGEPGSVGVAAASSTIGGEVAASEPPTATSPEPDRADPPGPDDAKEPVSAPRAPSAESASPGLGESGDASVLGGLTGFLVVGQEAEPVPSDAPPPHEEVEPDERAPTTPSEPTAAETPEVSASHPGTGDEAGDGSLGGLTQYFDVSALGALDAAQSPSPEEPSGSAGASDSPLRPEPDRGTAGRAIDPPSSPRDSGHGSGRAGGGGPEAPGAGGDGFDTLLMGVSKRPRAASPEPSNSEVEAAPSEADPSADRRSDQVSGLTRQFDRSASPPPSSGGVPETSTTGRADPPPLASDQQFSELAGWRLPGASTRPEPAGQQSEGVGLDSYMERLRSTPAPSPDRPAPFAAPPGAGSATPSQSIEAGGDATMLSPSAFGASSGTAGAGGSTPAPQAGGGLSKKTILVFVLVVVAVLISTIALLWFFSSRGAG